MCNSAALIIVDMIKDFTHQEGLVYNPQNRKIITNIKPVLEKCRIHGILIIYLQHCNRKDKPDRHIASMRPNCMEGTMGVEIDDALKVDHKKDYVIKKRRYSGFFATDLDMILREHDIEDIIIVGTKTNCCIRATVADAFYLYYNVIVLEDCVATDDSTVHRVHLNDIKKYFGVVVDSASFMHDLDVHNKITPRYRRKVIL